MDYKKGEPDPEPASPRGRYLPPAGSSKTLMGKSIDELASYVQPLCEQFFNLTQAAGIPTTLIDTGRTPTEQQQKLAQGVSWTQNSKHLPQPPEGKSEAFDVCPKEYLTIKNWCPGGPLWAKLGEIGESLGLEWGGRWKTTPDYGHFQWKPPQQVTLDAEDL